jgi:putative MATE family efflux protein
LKPLFRKNASLALPQPISTRKKWSLRLPGDDEAQRTRAIVLTLALPAIGEQMLVMMVGLADTYMVGRLSSSALTAVGLANQVIMLALTLVMAVASGATALVARQIGGGDRDGARMSMQQAVLLGIGVGTIVTLVITSLAGQAVSFFRPAADVQALGVQYLRVASLTFVFQSILVLGNASLRGAGDTRTPLYLMSLVNIVNIVVSYALIHGIGGLPVLGVLGSAIGAAVARGLGGLLMLALLARGRSGLRFSRPGWRPHREVIRRILNVGVPAGGEMLIMRLGEVSFARVISALGTAAYAAHHVAITGQSISFMPGFGFSVASTTLVGQSLGAGQPERGRASVREAMGMGAAFMGLGGLLLMALAPQVTAMFSTDPEVIRLGAACNRLLGLCQPVIAGMMIYSGALRGAGDTRYSMVITTLSVWLLRLPLAYLFTSGLGLGLQGAWYAIMIDMSLRTILYWRRFRSGAWTRVRV